jgi:hypothetical protein
MKTGRPKKSKTLPPKISAKMSGGAPAMPPGGMMPGAPSSPMMGMKKGGKVKAKKK